MSRWVLYPGTFDPFHKGHQDVVDQCLMMFDGVVIALMDNPDKTPMFSKTLRTLMSSTIIGDRADRIHVVPEQGLTVDVALMHRDIVAVVRGVREGDFQSELKFAFAGRILIKHRFLDHTPQARAVPIIWLPSYQEHMHISSTDVRLLLKSSEWSTLEDYLPPQVLDFLKQEAGV